MITGTLSKLKYLKYLNISELTTDESLKELMREFAYSRNPVKTCISLCRNGDITRKWMIKYKDIIVHYQQDIDTILQECGKLMQYLYPKYDKLQPLECESYKSWTAVRKLNIKYIFILSYIANKRIPLEEAKILYKQINLFTLLKLTNIRFNYEEQNIDNIEFTLHAS